MLCFLFSFVGLLSSFAYKSDHSLHLPSYLFFPATCDASLLPFSGMRAKFFDGIYGGKPTSQLQDKTFTIYLRGGVSVVMKKWKVRAHVRALVWTIRGCHALDSFNRRVAIK